MKRALELSAVVLLLLGVEVATGAASFALAHLHRVVDHLRHGSEPGISLLRFFLGMGMALLGVAWLVLGSWARGQARRMGVGRVCPECGEATERVRRRRWHRLLALLMGKKVTRRLCRECGWRGLATG